MRQRCLWYSIFNVTAKMTTDGLSGEEITTRQTRYGPNEIGQKKGLSWLNLAFYQFKSPLIYVLFIFGVVSLFLREWTDAAVIFLAVFINASLAFFQEFKAEKALSALKKLIVPHALVIRDGQEKLVNVDQLVPGDLVILKMGNRVPADGVLTEAKNFYLDEAILTGESRPVKKKALRRSFWKKNRTLSKAAFDQRNAVFMGTVIVSGIGKFIVTAAGKSTKIGQLAKQLEETAGEETPLRKQISHLAQTLTIVIGIVCLVIFLEGIIKGRSVVEMFAVAVAVAVASIPEGLAVSLTTILALGMERILKKKGLVRKLLAAETLGSVDIICLDKTGTLTEGKMRVVKVDAVDKKKLVWGAVCCNNLINPLDVALWNWGKKLAKEAGVPQACFSNGASVSTGGITKIDTIPFSSKCKFSAALFQKRNGQSSLYLTGAPEMILELMDLNEKEKEEWCLKLESYSQKGFRVVGMGFLDGELDSLKKKISLLRKKAGRYSRGIDGEFSSLKLNWLGLVLFEDPVREEVKSTLRLAKRAGIEIKVITGDYQATAESVLRSLGIVGENGLSLNRTIHGKELEAFSVEDLKERVEETVLFCRVTPDQKIKIVNALQEKGHVVAMMGDGVNDALALKKADIGVVVGDAAEVAKETADMVLLDSSFSTVLAAIEEGRTIFQNIRKVVLYLLSSSFSELILIGGSLLLDLPMPILPAQILWVNIIEDSLPALALAFEKSDGEELMRQKPRPKNTPILDKRLKLSIFLVGAITDLLMFGLYYFLLKSNYPIEKIRTIIFGGLAVDSLLFVFSCKNLDKNIWQTNPFSNPFLVFSVLMGFLVLLAGIYSTFFDFVLKTVPLEVSLWGWILFLGVIDVAVIEILKLTFREKKLK